MIREAVRKWHLQRRWVSRKDFRRQFIEAVGREAPAVRCEESAVDELDVRIEGASEHLEVKVSLHRAYAEFEEGSRGVR